VKPAGVVGLGAVGSRVARQLTASGSHLVVFDPDPAVLAGLGSSPNLVTLTDGNVRDDVADVVVVATPAPQAPVAIALLRRGLHVITTTDDPDDVHELLGHDSEVSRLGRCLVVGAAASPGMTGLMVSELRHRFDDIDEIHVAFHGTGGPACARQHHRALGGEAIGWHDGEWIERPGGSGRELFWFPEPIGGKDCYRAELADPIVLHRAFPSVKRISARVSATRRDRLTARLPMMSPPHPEGGLGGLRVEVRGSLDGARVTHVAGIAERTAVIAGALAAAVADQLQGGVTSGNIPAGVVVVGDGQLDELALMTAVIQRGITVFEYIGAAG
jgi:hypothetical protein